MPANGELLELISCHLLKRDLSLATMEVQQTIIDGANKVAAIVALQQDLQAVSESRLLRVERLCADLDAHIEAFKHLLDHKPKNEISRSDLKCGALY